MEEKEIQVNCGAAFEILGALQWLRSVMQLQVKHGFALKKAIAALASTPEIVAIASVRQEALKKYGEEKGGGVFHVPAHRMAAYTSELNEVWQLPLAIKIPVLPYSVRLELEQNETKVLTSTLDVLDLIWEPEETKAIDKPK